MANLKFWKNFWKDENGQLIIIVALIFSILLAGLSLVYTQNLLAGTESSLTQLNFPRNEIRDLRNIALEELRYYAINNPSSFLEYAEELRKQITALYASHGSYADIEVYDIKMSADGSITSFTVKIIFSNMVVDYEAIEMVIV
jgi:hypothetical protein